MGSKTAAQLADELKSQMDKFKEYLDEAMQCAKELESLIKEHKTLTKGEEPKFKVGDWVRWKNDDNHKPCRVYKGNARYVGSLDDCLNNPSNYEIWSPQEGDIIICLNTANHPMIMDFEEYKSQTEEFSIEYEKVIPYIGQLFEDMK